jgi:enoyl-CoA hydratase
VLVHTSTSDRVVTVTLDSPRNRNALSRELVSGLSDALADAAGDEGAHAVMLTHTGPAFCSGAALDEMSASSTGQGTASQGTADLVALIRQLLTLPVPVVAVVDGATRAGGLGLLGACDIVLASPRATFAFTEVRLGLAPAIISMPLLPLLSARAASRYFLTGETFDAAVAASIGLVTSVTDHVQPVLDGLRAADRQGLAATKPLTVASRLAALDGSSASMTALSASLFASPVAQAHFAAFLSSRKGLPCCSATRSTTGPPSGPPRPPSRSARRRTPGRSGASGCCG